MESEHTRLEINLYNLPRFRILPHLYRFILSITRKHGMFTLARFHERFFGGDQCVDIPTGAQLFIPGDPHYFGFLAGVHESHITSVIKREVRPGDLCIDVGANIGYFSMILAKAVGATGRVIAFEPVIDTFRALCINTSLAESCGLNVSAHQAAISEEDGELVIECQEHSTLNQVRAIESECDATDRRVKCYTLLSFLIQEHLFSPIALLKIDVEGHELSVVKGAIPILKSGQIRRLILEITPGADALQIGAILAECKAMTRVWDGRHWGDIPLKNLLRRTDILVTFPEIRE